ncbi:MAG: ribonuclease E/G [Oscillospiraceae bacterium]|jgi:ribonuclease G|nr:ribonuclease E/G [Oscillospiraceae bacterium]
MERELVLETLGGVPILALLEDGEPREIVPVPPDAEPDVGSLYAGRVTRVVPGMRAAFVDIGASKNAFLPFDADEAPHQGDAVLVQAAKQPGGEKGLRVTRRVTLPGRLAVLRPGGACGVSAKIRDAQERARLLGALQSLCPPGVGALARTAAQGAGQDALAQDLGALLADWAAVQAAWRQSQAPRCLRRAPHPAQRLLQDVLGPQLIRVVTDSSAWHARLAADLADWGPANPPALALYRGETPLSDLYPIRRALQDALRRKVWLPCGGYLVFDICEALTVVDVNTGKHTGAADTALAVNLQAALAVARQLRLRDIGGIVVVDFIDMDAPESRQMLLDAFTQALAEDRAAVQFFGEISPFGLAQLTRRRLFTGLMDALTLPCPACRGAGHVPSPQATAREIWLQLARRAASGEDTRWRVCAPSPVLQALLQAGVPPAWQVLARAQGPHRGEGFAIAPLGDEGDTGETGDIPLPSREEYDA